MNFFKQFFSSKNGSNSQDTTVDIEESDDAEVSSDLEDDETLTAENISQSHHQATEPKRRFTKRFKLFLVFLIILVAVGGVFMSPLFYIESIAVDGAKNLSEEEIIETSQLKKGTPLVLAREKHVQENLVKNLYIAEASMSKDWPHKVVIHIVERQPIGIFKNDDHYWLVSSEGVIIDKLSSVDERQVPVISGVDLEQETYLGEVIENESLLKAVEILNACERDLLATIQEINVADPLNIYLYTSEGIEIRFGGSENADIRMHQLSDILDQIVLTNTLQAPIEYIDISSTKAPVIKLKGEAGNIFSFNDETDMTGETQDPGGAVDRAPLTDTMETEQPEEDITNY